MSRRRAVFTIVIVPESGRGSLRIEIPAWSIAALRACAALVVGMIAFVGWQLQGQYGLSGPRMIQLGVFAASGQRFTPFEQVAKERAMPSRAELRRRVAAERATRLQLGDRRAASFLLLGIVAPEWERAAREVGPSDGTLLWPVRTGGYGRGFGSGQDGYHLAIDIAGERGADVLASAPGIVGYAGRELRGYGNVVMLVHPGGRVTLYGHNQRNLVVAGERVYQGQAIAELGSTGRSMGPHLHFELKHDGRNCDPLPLMRAMTSSAVRVPSFTPASWLPEDDRPETVRCKPRRMHPDPEEDESLVGAGAPTPDQAHPG